MYQYILFDLDGTLTDPREGITKSVQYALDKMGISEPDLSALEHFIGPPLYDEFRPLLSDGRARRRKRRSRPTVSASALSAGRKTSSLTACPSFWQRFGMPDGKSLSPPLNPPFSFGKSSICSKLSGTSTSFPAHRLTAASAARRRSCSRRSMRSACPTSKPLSSSATASTMSRAHARAVWTARLTLGFGGREELETAGASAVVDSLEELCGVLLAG